MYTPINPVGLKGGGGSKLYKYVFRDGVRDKQQENKVKVK